MHSEISVHKRFLMFRKYTIGLLKVLKLISRRLWFTKSFYLEGERAKRDYLKRILDFNSSFSLDSSRISFFYLSTFAKSSRTFVCQTSDFCFLNRVSCFVFVPYKLYIYLCKNETSTVWHYMTCI